MVGGDVTAALRRTARRFVTTRRLQQPQGRLASENPGSTRVVGGPEQERSEGKRLLRKPSVVADPSGSAWRETRHGSATRGSSGVTRHGLFAGPRFTRDGCAV
jgi:hypothetical protein